MQLDQYRSFLRDETDAAHLYGALAEGEKRPELAELYRSMARDEQRHAAYWSRRLIEAGAIDVTVQPTRRTRVLATLARRAGARVVIPVVARRETAERFAYERTPNRLPPDVLAKERSHARLVRIVSRGGPDGLDGAVLARTEGQPRVVGGNALRAAVLGANDGLVSNTSLVMGVAGANFAPKAVLVAGLAGLLAGAISMAMGEWVSVRSSQELHEFQGGLGRGGVVFAPPEEADQLALVYQARGMKESEASELAERVIADLNTNLEAAGRLAGSDGNGNGEDAGGSPWIAAAVSFVLFSLGALIPVVPFTLTSGSRAIAWALGGAALGLVVIGSVITLFTGRPLWRSGLRQLAIGLAAASVTYGAGRLVGTGLGS